jgi:hypothetical protein
MPCTQGQQADVSHEHDFLSSEKQEPLARADVLHNFVDRLEVPNLQRRGGGVQCRLRAALLRASHFGVFLAL